MKDDMTRAACDADEQLASNNEGDGNDDTGLSLADMLRLDDEALVDEAYRRLLRREPDAEGRASYLHQLRLGKLNKIELLGGIRYSPEGRGKGVRVKGLAGAYARQVFFRVPVLGYLADLVWSIATLPRTLRSFRSFQSTAVAQARLSAAGIELLTREVATVLSNIAASLAEVPRRQELEELQERVECAASRAELDLVGGRVEEVWEQLEQGRRQLRQLQQQLFELSGELTGGVELGAEGPSFDDMYLAFEDHFRGTREEISKRLEIYLPEVRAALQRSEGQTVLDLGCGRGEWLELLRHRDIAAVGVDCNVAMVRLCQERDLVVSESEVLTYLQEQPAGCYAVVTGFHLAEHLPFARLIVLLDQIERVLLPGGILILETPNPENLIVGGCTFYSDPTHRHPLVPETLRFFVSQRGFHQVEVRRLHPYRELHQVEPTDPFTASWLHNEMDYAVIGVKT